MPPALYPATSQEGTYGPDSGKRETQTCRKLAEGISSKLPYWLEEEELLRQLILIQHRTLQGAGICGSALKS